MTDAAPPSDEDQFKWYTALRFGEVIGEGPTPMPKDIKLQATEIRWSMSDDGNNDPPEVRALNENPPEVV
jgi:hypothetical protein